MYTNYIKNKLDILISIIFLLLLSPVLVILTIILFLQNKGNPFFIQTRPGKKGKLFNIIKFKTMNDKRDSSNNLLPDAARLSKIGGFIRKTSFDEIPQLLNVLKGDMSLIGPRPLLPQYLPLYNTFQNKRHDLKPGITGWAQVNGRNAISWQDKFEYDVWYVDHVSFLLDFKIFFLTLNKIINPKDISSSTSVTMEGFKGNN